MTYREALVKIAGMKLDPIRDDPIHEVRVSMMAIAKEALATGPDDGEQVLRALVYSTQGVEWQDQSRVLGDLSLAIKAQIGRLQRERDDGLERIADLEESAAELEESLADDRSES